MAYSSSLALNSSALRAGVVFSSDGNQHTAIDKTTAQMSVNKVAEADESRNTAAPISFRGSPQRAAGVRLHSRGEGFIFNQSALVISVLKYPGAIPLTRYYDAPAHAHVPRSQHLHGTLRCGVGDASCRVQLALHRTDVLITFFLPDAPPYGARNGLRDEKTAV